MLVIGIDPGTRNLGWGLVERIGTKLVHRGHGVIRANRARPDEEPREDSLALRLVRIDALLAEVITAYRPQVAAVEGLFFHKDAQAAAKLGHARGVVLLGLHRSGLEVFEYEPARVKRTVAGHGAADKRQVAAIVSAMLELDVQPKPDAADALAIALTHLAGARFGDALGSARGTKLPAKATRKRFRPPPGLVRPALGAAAHDVRARTSEPALSAAAPTRPTGLNRIRLKSV